MFGGRRVVGYQLGPEKVDSTEGASSLSKAQIWGSSYEFNITFSELTRLPVLGRNDRHIDIATD
jgi:hypothetical protein